MTAIVGHLNLVSESFLRQESRLTSPGTFRTFTDAPTAAQFSDGSAEGILSFAVRMVYNPIGRRIQFVGSGHNPSGGLMTRLEYDEITRTWDNSLTLPVTNNWQHAGCRNAIDPTTGDHFYNLRAANSGMRVLRESTRNWDTVANIPLGPFSEGEWGNEYFPEIGAFIACDSAQNDHGILQWNDTGGTGSWSQFVTAAAIDENGDGSGGICAKYTPLGGGQVLVGGAAGGGAQIAYMIESDATATRLTALPGFTDGQDLPGSINTGAAGGRITKDPVSNKLLIFARDGVVYAWGPGDSGWANVDTHGYAGENWFTTCEIPEYGVNMLFAGNPSPVTCELYRAPLGI